MEDEAVLDRGASFVKHVCDEEEVEGKLSDEREREREREKKKTPAHYLAHEHEISSKLSHDLPVENSSPLRYRRRIG